MSDAREDFEALTQEQVLAADGRTIELLVGEEALVNMHRLAERVKKDNVASDPAWLLAELVSEALYDPREDE